MFGQSARSLWRRRPGRRSKPPPPEEGLLVISDIHLGEDILSGGPTHLAGYIRSLNKHLADFIAHHRESDAQRRWHLVINGDMFDFVKVSVAPVGEEVAEVGEATLASLAKSGSVLENTAANVVYKLGRILEIHRPLFREMGRFLAQGHRVTIIEGNHDAEFYFPEVRERLRDELVRLARPKDSEQAAQIGDRLQFRPWFLAKVGHYHIEHGHQYDEFCSFEYNLAPMSDSIAGTLATPLSHRPMPYFAELLGDFSTHDVNQWSIRRTLRFLAEMGAKNVWTLTRLYLWVGWRLIRDAGGQRRQRRHLFRGRHQEALSRLSGPDSYPLAVLRRLDALKATPAEWAPGKMLHLFLFDRLMVAAVALLLSPWAASVHGWRGVGLVAVAALLFIMVLSLGHREETGPVLRRAAGQVADVAAAKVVIFGHSHQPERVDLRARFGVGRFGVRPVYLNSGSWVTREILRGEAGRGMTYVQLDGQAARLMRWMGPKRPPREMAMP